MASGCVFKGDHDAARVERRGNGWAAFLDWRTHQPIKRSGLYLVGPCRCCGRESMLRDCTGTWCHKVCAEREAANDARITATRAAQLAQLARPA